MMRMKTYIGAIAALLMLPSMGSAATYNLGGNGGNLGAAAVFSTVGAPNISIVAGAVGVLNTSAAIVQTAGGLGVAGLPDSQRGQIDGNPFRSDEFLTITFAKAVKLIGFGLSDADGNDAYDISVNGGTFVSGLTALASNSVNQKPVTSFVLRASGTFRGDQDDFKLSSISVAAVPVPAAGLMLVGALGGLAALRRRKTA